MVRTTGRARAPGGRMGILAALLLAGPACLPPSLAAKMILEPKRRVVQETQQPPHAEVVVPGRRRRAARLVLPGRGAGRRHGDLPPRQEPEPGHRASCVAQRLVPLGYNVLAYDSRAHGESGGRYTTFGYYEKRDVSRAIDFLGVDRVFLAGISLGAAVAIQSAAEDSRVAGVIAISSFASLEEVVRDRLPGFIPAGQIRGALRAVERRANIRVKDVDAVAAARRIEVPVLLLHGSLDRFTPLDHTERIYGALQGPRELVEVDGAGHADVLASDQAWTAILDWFASLPGPPGRYAAHLDRLDPQVNGRAQPRRNLDPVRERAPVSRANAN